MPQRSTESDAADAIGELYREFERMVLGYFMRATREPEVAADLAAETFARALECMDEFDPARGAREQWLFGIARNVLASSYRQRRVDAAARRRLAMPQLVLDDHVLEVIGRIDASGSSVTLALADLPQEQRKAIEDRVLRDHAYEDIAEQLQCSEAVVRQRVSRGLRTLRTRMAGER